MDSKDFERFEAAFRRSGLAAEDHWVVDGSVVYKNDEAFVDLRNVERISAGITALLGSTHERLVFEWSGGSVKMTFDLGLRTARNNEWEALKRSILIRYGHYRPDGEVDLRGDRLPRVINSIVGACALAAGLALLIYTIASADSLRDSGLSPWIPAGVAAVLIVIGALRLVMVVIRPQRAAEVGNRLRRYS